MVLHPAAEGTMPISGSSGVHASDWPLHDPQADLEYGLSSVHANGWPLHDPQRDLESGLSRLHVNEWPLHDPRADLESGLSRVHVHVHVNDWPLRDPQVDLISGLSRVHVEDWPLRESQADLEAGRAYQEKTHSTPAAPLPPPAYSSFVSSYIEPSAQTQLYAQRPFTTNNTMDGQPKDDPESAERQRETIRTMIESAVVEQLAKKEDEEDNAKMKDFIIRLIVWTLFFCLVYFMSKFSS